MRLTKKGFKEWLQSKEPDTCVGYADNCYHCPIATYLTDTVAEFAEVRQHHYKIVDDEGKDVKNNLPDWAKKFVKGVDKIGHNISADKALKVLNSRK